MTCLRIFGRGYLIVTLTALNVVLVSRGFYALAFFTGGALSWVWWGNSRRANRQDGRLAQWAYTAGAAAGTACGMWIGRMV